LHEVVELLFLMPSENENIDADFCGSFLFREVATILSTLSLVWRLLKRIGLLHTHLTMFCAKNMFSCKAAVNMIC